MAEETPQVAVIMGSASDWETMKHACEMLDQFKVPYMKQVISAHRTPELMADFAHSARDKGIKVIYEASRAFAGGGDGQTSPVSCSNITITNGDFYEYLMAYEDVTSIVVDGANRKWVGTASGGLYLLSANGMEQIRHFTAANSPLFSDKILSLAIQPRSGEVYVGTDYGVQVYRSDATYAELTPDEHVYAFPNPVRPGYEGPVAIKGFTRNALVHITDASRFWSTSRYLVILVK